ncbi:MAG: hypothetical protein HYY06_04445 [Deltaproteobacteria bacterium]|nr:hypothetical protein [Deltaproteobacteria bacterium]
MARSQTRNRLVSAFVLWGGCAALLFIAYAVVERIWLEDLGPDARNAAHLARGILVSLVTTMVTAAYLLGRVVPRLETSLGAADGSTGPQPPSGPALAAWLVGMRWVAVVALGAVVAFATLGTEHVPAGSAWALWVGVGALAALNGLATLVPRARLGRPGALVAQIAGDVAILGWLVHHAGGLTNPFAGFFVFHAVVAGIVLDAALARRVVAAIACFVLALTALEASGLVPPVGLTGLYETGERPWLHAGAVGLAVATMVVGCALIVVALVRTLRDEHDRLSRARGEVQAEREKLQSIIDCMADAVVFIGPDKTIQLRNRAADQLWPGGSPHGTDLRVCHPSGAWDRLTLKLKEPGPAGFHPVIPVGGRSFEATMAPVSDARGSNAGVVMVARDITERLEKQKWQVDHERMAVVGKLAAGLAHEINNPLGAMVLFTQHALKGIAPEDPLADHLQTVLRNANLCKKIVKDLLEYARRRPPERIDLDLAALLGDVVRTLSPGADGAMIRIQSRIDAGVPARFCGDPDQLRQVLVNLGLNAIEAMSSGGTLELLVRCPDRAHLSIDVSDTGPGIPAEDRERIFSAFFTTKPGGTGLGLAVARDLVAAHGGTLDFASEGGKGTTFTATLPVAPQRASLASEAAEKEAAA